MRATAKTSRSRPTRSSRSTSAPEGSGWAVGGWSGQADDAGRGTTAKGSGQTIRENVQTAGIYSYAPGGAPQGPPGDGRRAGLAAAPAWRRSPSPGTPSARTRAPSSPTRGSRPTAT